MRAILYCDKKASCIPAASIPEALLPICNVPLLTLILQHLDREGYDTVTLIGADAATRELAESLEIRAILLFADQPIPEAPCDLVRKRLCRAKTPSEYLRFQQELLRHPQMENKRIGENVRIGRGVQISEDCVIGNDCIIGDHAVLEGCMLGDGVQIGAGARLRHCVLCRHALADRSTELSDAVVGEGEIASSHLPTIRKRRICVDALDGIHEGLPRWNNAETALRTGAALTSLGMRIAVGYANAACEAYALASAVGAMSQGAQVWNCGPCVLSQMMYVGRQVHCDVLLHVHGGSVRYLTVRTADGEPLTQAQCRTLRRSVESRVSARIADCGTLCDARCLLALWESECRSHIPASHPITEVCCGSTVLRNAAASLFCGGCGDRLVLNLSEDGTQASVFSVETGMVSHEALLRLVLRLSEGGRFPRDLFTDGILLFANVLGILEKRRISLADACALLPPFAVVKREISTKLGGRAVDKLRREIPDTAVTIAPPTACGIVRLAAYAESMETAAELCDFWESRIRREEVTQGDLSQYAE